MTDYSHYGLATRGVRAGQVRTAEGEHSEPIFQTSSFVFDSAAHAAARFSGEEPGNIYSRFTNPTVRMFEQKLAAMEEGQSCVAMASGMAAIQGTLMALLQQGDHIVAANGIFGSTVMLLNNYYAKFGVDTSYVPLTDYAAWEAAIKPNTRILFVETPANPLAEVADIKRLAEIAHQRDCLLIVDNTVCTAALQQPLLFGADIVVVSATKYIDGQGRCIGGAVIGDEKRVGEQVFGYLRTAGPAMSPFNAWVFLKGLETLRIRMTAHSKNARELASWLDNHAKVKHTYYAGLASHPHHELAKRQQINFGGLVAFEVEGGQDAAWQVIDATQMISITANLGDAKSTITHPATTTHARLTPEERAQAGISDSLVRVSVGLEDIDDIKLDIARGLDRL